MQFSAYSYERVLVIVEAAIKQQASFKPQQQAELLKNKPHVAASLVNLASIILAEVRPLSNILWARGACRRGSCCR